MKDSLIYGIISVFFKFFNVALYFDLNFYLIFGHY